MARTTNATGRVERALTRGGRFTRERLDVVGEGLVTTFHLLGLFVIGATVVWAAAHTYFEMMQAGRAQLDDILLLFIYLEMGAMVGIYFKTERLPVLFLLYIAITAMTRFLVIDIKTLPDEKILIITGAILVITVAVLVLQYATAKFGVEEVRRKDPT